MSQYQLKQTNKMKIFVAALCIFYIALIPYLVSQNDYSSKTNLILTIVVIVMLLYFMFTALTSTFFIRLDVEGKQFKYRNQYGKWNTFKMKDIDYLLLINKPKEKKYSYKIIGKDKSVLAVINKNMEQSQELFDYLRKNGKKAERK